MKIVNLNLKVREGEYLVIMGPNGAGKTILLLIIAGILKPDRGRVLINGVDVTDKGPEHRGIALMPQTLALFPHLNAYENIAYGLRVRKFDEETIRRKVYSIANTLGITHLLRKYPAEMSEGEKQLVALARTLVIKPKILLLDEPTSSLDMAAKEKVIKLLREYHRRYKPTVIHVTHDITEALRLADRIIVMENGRITCELSKDVFKELISHSEILIRELRRIYSVMEVKSWRKDIFSPGKILEG